MDARFTEGMAVVREFLKRYEKIKAFYEGLLELGDLDRLVEQKREALEDLLRKIREAEGQ